MEYKVKTNYSFYITLKENEIVYFDYKGVRLKKFKFLMADKTGKFCKVFSEEGETLWLHSNTITDWAGRYSNVVAPLEVINFKGNNELL